MIYAAPVPSTSDIIPESLFSAFSSSAFFEAASCHAGIPALPVPKRESGAAVVDFSTPAAGDSIGCAGLMVGFAMLPPPTTLAVPRGPNMFAPAFIGRCGAEAGVAGGGAMRFATSVLRLFSSIVSSLSLVSVFSSCPFNAFGIMACRPWTSSAIRLVSSSLRRLAFLSSVTTASTSVSAVSSRSLRHSSEALIAAVSFASWSIKSNACLNEASIAALSASSCGGVGGAISGAMYRYETRC